MKTQRDIGTARVVKFCNGLHKTLSPIGHEADDDGWDGALVDIPVNTIVKLSIEEEVEEIEPKRTLVVPEGVCLLRHKNAIEDYTYIYIENHTIGRFSLGFIGKPLKPVSGKIELWFEDKIKTFYTVTYLPGPVSEDAFEKLADLGWHGFGWKRVC